MNDEKDVVSIPYFVHEGEMSRLERINKKCFILIIILIIALIGTNVGWIWHESQYEDVVTTITQEGEADNNGTVLLNNGGDLNYGYESKSDDND